MGYVKLSKPFSFHICKTPARKSRPFYTHRNSEGRVCTLVVLYIQSVSTKRPALYVQQIHREAGGGEQAVTSTKALALEQPGLICKTGL